MLSGEYAQVVCVMSWCLYFIGYVTSNNKTYERVEIILKPSVSISYCLQKLPALGKLRLQCASLLEVKGKQIWNSIFKRCNSFLCRKSIGTRRHSVFLILLWLYGSYAGYMIRDPQRFEFLWVEEFPLFTRNDDGQLEATHHPFTAPVEDDVQLLRTEPEKVKTKICRFKSMFLLLLT